MEIEIKEGKYIYCIVSANGSRSFGPLGIGGRGDELYTVCFNDIAAVVSDSPIKKYPAAREHFLAHEKAIEEVMKGHTVLPVRFCTITEDEEKVKKILEKEFDKFKNLLNKFEGKKELGLKAIFKEEIYKNILEKYAEIMLLKEDAAALPPEKAYYQRIELGRKVEAALQEEKEIYKGEILSALSPLAVEVKTNNPYGETMLLSAAFLVEGQKETEFDQKVQELDARYGDKIRFKYVGTLPPFNFVNLIIRIEEDQHVSNR